MHKQKNYRILVVITNYGNNQLECLKKILREYNNFKKYSVKVILVNTEYIKDLNYPNLDIEQKLFDESLKLWLTHKHKKIMYDNRNNYDIFIYSENDMLITEKHLDLFLKHSKNLKNTNYIPGFLRYEIRENKKYLIDCHKIHTVHKSNFYKIIKFLTTKKLRFYLYSIVKNFSSFYPIITQNNIKINDKEYFIVQNPHQACYILTRDQLKIILNSGNYFNEKYNYAGIREGAASNVFLICGVNKVISKEDLEDSLIYHLSNIYTKSYPIFIKEQPLTYDKIKNLIKMKNDK